jgi:ABC-2 type transport system ATP-binding protein
VTDLAIQAQPTSGPAAAVAIATSGLAKHFGELRAVDGIDLSVPAGSVYGFLGPNGSGKTTTIRILLGLISATGGECQLFGLPMPAAAGEALPQVGALIEGPAFYPWLTGRENLTRIDLMGSDPQNASRKQRIADALERVGLTVAADRKYRAYSLGMRQRLGLAAALLRPRRLLILDEPTNGMDPQGTREIRHLIRELGLGGTTVFLSSHLLSEVEQVCSHVGVMHRGRLLTQGTLEELRRSGATRLRIEVDDTVRASEILRQAGLSDVVVTGTEVTGGLENARPEDCNRMLVEAGVAVRSLVSDRPTLEDLFVGLTGEGFDVAR